MQSQINPAKKYMLDYREIVLQIRSLIRARDQHLRDVGRYEDAFERATKSTSRLRAVAISGTSDHDGMANAVMDMIRYQEAAQVGSADADEITRRLNETIVHQAEMLGARLAIIQQLSDERYKTVMLMRYVEGASWDKIMRETNYERTWVWALHGRALREVETFLKE